MYKRQFQKGSYDVLHVSALIQLRDVDPVVATLTRGIHKAQHARVYHLVKVHDDGCPGNRLTLTQLLVRVLPGLPRPCALFAQRPDVPEGDLLVLPESFP